MRPDAGKAGCTFAIMWKNTATPGQLPARPDGVKHAYLGAGPACWEIYGQVLAKEYGDPAHMKFHRWTVDAYAAQHPGIPEPRTIQSINVHLLALYLLVEKKSDPQFATIAMGKIIENQKRSFKWLTPPANLGAITVVQVAAANSVEEHGKLVMAWAHDVWAAWHEYHSIIKSVAATLE